MQMQMQTMPTNRLKSKTDPKKNRKQTRKTKTKTAL